MFLAVRKLLVSILAMGVVGAVGATPAYAGYARSASETTQNGVSAYFYWTYISRYAWNMSGSQYLEVCDTDGDSSSVYGEIKDNYGQEGGDKTWHGGNGTCGYFYPLSYTSDRGRIQWLAIRGCVDSIGTDECDTSSHVSNPYP